MIFGGTLLTLLLLLLALLLVGGAATDTVPTGLDAIFKVVDTGRMP